jgi:hypothetical protein
MSEAILIPLSLINLKNGLIIKKAIEKEAQMRLIKDKQIEVKKAKFEIKKIKLEIKER